MSGRRLVDVRTGQVASIREMSQAQLFGLILRLVQMTFRFDTCAIFSYDAKTRRVILIENIGMGTSGGGSEFISLDDDPVIQQVVTEAKAIVVNTPVSEGTSAMIRAIMAVPIVLNDSVVGTLNMSCVSARPYEDEDMNRLNAIASQAAVLVQSLRTFADLEAEQREILETVPMAIVRVVFKENRCVVNAAAREFFDLKSDHVGLDDFYRQSRAFLDKDISKILDDIRRDGRDIGAVEIKGRGGRDAVMNLTISAILSEERTLGAVLVFEDLTEILHAREVAERNERLAALGHLAAGVAHEVKNPLTSIKGFTQLLKSKKTDVAFIEKYVGLVSNEVDRLDRIVEQLLQLSRPNTAKLKKDDLRGCGRRVVQLIEASFEQKSVKYEERFPVDPVRVSIDAAQIEQVMLNILLNAIEAVDPHRGVVRAVIEIKPQTVVYAVEDNGRGIKPEHLEKLFHPFFTTRRGGTGLGLAVSHRIVTDHGGRIYVTSEPGKGARFAFELPAAGDKS